MLFKSPLHHKKGQTTLSIIALALILIAIPGWMVIIPHSGLLSIWTWVPYTIAGSLIAYLIITFFDRKKGIRQFHFLVILSVILITAPIAALINDYSPAKFVTVGFNEEFFKILLVLLLAVFLPNLIRTGFILILIWQLIKSLKWEQKIYIDQLSTEDSSIVSSDEMELIKGEGILNLRKYKRYPKKEAKRIVRYQNLLAMLKKHASDLNLPLDKVEEIEIIRRGIMGAKQQFSEKG